MLDRVVYNHCKRLPISLNAKRHGVGVARREAHGHPGREADRPGHRRERPGELLAVAHAPVEQELLEAVVGGYKGNRGKSKIIVRGHASADEPKPAELAQARAKAVAEWLIGAGIPKDRIEIRSYGADAPIERNDDETKASMNRRVDFEAVPEPKPEPKSK